MNEMKRLGNAVKTVLSAKPSTIKQPTNKPSVKDSNRRWKMVAKPAK